MKKILSLALILLLSISLLGCVIEKEDTQPEQEDQNAGELQQAGPADEEAVTNLVENFGKKLQLVSLQAPEDTLKKSMQENYGDYVSPELLEKWINDPLNAPGRLTSSPWPDRIEIQNINKLSADSYEVKGKIIEITSEEKTNEGAATNRPITLVVKKTDDNWLINSVTLGEYAKSDSIVYKNTEYGFNFSLPESWKGFTIITDKWEGQAIEGEESGKVVETGPLISIRHPEWTPENPRQDIPIMIFTHNQWSSLQEEEFHIGAAPIGPSELGRNNKYVFALPARYNFAFPTGYEEVDKIIQSHPLHPIDE